MTKERKKGIQAAHSMDNRMGILQVASHRIRIRLHDHRPEYPVVLQDQLLLMQHLSRMGMKPGLAGQFQDELDVIHLSDPADDGLGGTDQVAT
jgi:hypothetical protein